MVSGGSEETSSFPTFCCLTSAFCFPNFFLGQLVPELGGLHWTGLHCLSAVLGAGGLVGQACFENKQECWEEVTLKSRFQLWLTECLHLSFMKSVQLGFLLSVTLKYTLCPTVAVWSFTVLCGATHGCVRRP